MVPDDSVGADASGQVAADAPHTKDEGPGANQTPLSNTNETEPAFCSDDEVRHKTLAGYQASLALAGGFALQELADGSFVVTRWNLCRPLADLMAVRAFARQVGAIHA